jgi:hypothetical protein
LELIIRQLIARLILSIILGPLLHSIVGQVNELVVETTEHVLFTGRSQVAFIVDVRLQVSIHCRAKYIGTNIKLSAVYEQRIVDVLLNYARPAAICRRVLHDALDLIVFPRNLNTMPSVGVLARLDDPNVLGSRWRLIVLWLILIFLLIGTARGLPWTLHITFGVRFRLIFVLLGLLLLQFGRRLLIFHVLFILKIVVFESLEFWVVQAGFDVESQRDVLENILIHSFIIVFHIKKQCFLVVDVKIVFNLVIKF